MPPAKSGRAFSRHVVLVCLALGLVLSSCARPSVPSPAGPSEIDLGAGPTPVILTLVYQDSFADQSSGWDDAFDAYTMKQYGGHQYHIQVRAPNLFAWGLSNRNISDFVLDVKATQESTPDNNSYGVVFRYQDRDNFYRFDVTGDGLFLLSKFVAGRWLTLVDWTASPAVKRGRAANLLRVSCLGSNLSVYANGQLLAATRDESFRQGDIGLFAGAFDQPDVEISFDDLFVWAPPGVAITARPTSGGPAEPRSQGAASHATPLIAPTAAGAPVSATPPAAALATPTSTSRAAPVIERASVSPPLTETVSAPPVVTDEPLRHSPVQPTRPTGQPPVVMTPIIIGPHTPVLRATPEVTTTASASSTRLPAYVSAVQPKPHNARAQLGQIAYPLFDAVRGVYDIYLLDLAGGQSRRVIENASQPALNASGTHLAYRSWANDMRGLVSRDLGGAEIWRFTTFSEAARPVWAPNDELFLFHSRQESDRITRLFRTRDITVEGVRRDGEVIKGECPDFLDATHIVYKGCLGNHCGLITSALDGAGARQLTDNLSDTAPAASPDGARIAFMSQRDGAWGIYLIHRDGSGLVNLTPDAANNGLPTWSPDGGQLAYLSDRNGAWGLWTMSADGAHSYQVARLPGSPDGRVRTASSVESIGWTEEHLSWSK